MKPLLVLLIFVIFSLLSTSCTPPPVKDVETDISYGDYDNAVYKAWDYLKQHPDNKRCKELLKEAYWKAVKNHKEQIRLLESRIEIYEVTSTIIDLKKLISEYESFIEFYTKINTSNKKIKPLKDSLNLTRKKLEDAKLKDAEHFYQEAREREKTAKTKDDYKFAAQLYRKVLEIIPNYKDCNIRLQRTLKRAIKRMLILEFEDKSGKSGYGDIGTKIRDEIISSLLNDPDVSMLIEIAPYTETKIISEKAAIKIGKELGVHEILIGWITQINPPDPKTSTRTEQFKTVIYEQPQQPNLQAQQPYVQPQQKTVSAIFTIYEKQAKTTIDASYKIIDGETGRLIDNQTFIGTCSFYCQWAEYQGDEEAAKRSPWYYLLQQQKRADPSDAEEVEKARDSLINSIVHALKSHIH